MRRQILWSALAVAAVTLSAGVVAGAAIRRQLVHESETELLRQAEATANLISVSVRAGLAGVGERTEVTPVRTLEIARRVGGHAYVEARLVGAGPVAGLDLGDTRLLDAIGDDPPLDQVIRIEVDGRPVLAVVRSTPLVRYAARLLVAIGRSEPLVSSDILTEPLLISLGIGALLAVALATLISRRVGRRLERLEAASHAVADGDFTARAPAAGSDDVARLGAAFNDMAAQLASARRRERDFLMSVGHDLRTPLTTIRGYAEGLEAGDIEPADLPRVAGVLRRQTDRLSRLIEDLTLLARLEAREFTVRTEAVDIAAHLRGLVEAHRSHAAELHIRLQTELDDVGTIDIDPDRVGQILGNLIGNALRYTPEGGSVTVALHRAGDAVVMGVRDTGPGIDRDDLPHVFERLYVAQRYRPVRPEGSGLGLSIVRELAGALGGEVAVSSTLGSGTEVAVTLPASRRPA